MLNVRMAIAEVLYTIATRVLGPCDYTKQNNEEALDYLKTLKNRRYKISIDGANAKKRTELLQSVLQIQLLA
jgi:hypothetical protein